MFFLLSFINFFKKSDSEVFYYTYITLSSDGQIRKYTTGAKKGLSVCMQGHKQNIIQGAGLYEFSSIN